MRELPRAGAVVLNYVTYEETRTCVDDLLRQHYPGLEITVVDNCSPNDSFNLLSKTYAPYPNVHVVQTESNSGYAGGNNFGIRSQLERRSVDYVLVVTSDVRIPDQRTLETLADFAERTPHAGVVGPKVLFDGRVQGPFSRPNVWGQSLQFAVPPVWYVARTWRRLASRGIRGPRPCYRTIGACMLIRVAPFVEVGMFDETTFLGAEENILAEKLMRLGLHFYYFPDVAVIHNHDRSAISATMERARALRIVRDSSVYYFRAYRGAGEMSLNVFRRAVDLYIDRYLPLRKRLGLG